MGRLQVPAQPDARPPTHRCWSHQCRRCPWGQERHRAVPSGATIPPLKTQLAGRARDSSRGGGRRLHKATDHPTQVAAGSTSSPHPPNASVGNHNRQLAAGAVAHNPFPQLRGREAAEVGWHHQCRATRAATWADNLSCMHCAGWLAFTDQRHGGSGPPLKLHHSHSQPGVRTSTR